MAKEQTSRLEDSVAEFTRLTEELEAAVAAGEFETALALDGERVAALEKLEGPDLAPAEARSIVNRLTVVHDRNADLVAALKDLKAEVGSEIRSCKTAADVKRTYAATLAGDD